MDIMTITDRLAAVGESKLATSIDTIPGGKGANAAVAAYRLSHHRSAQARSSSQNEIQVRMIGAVGNDSFGKTCLEALEGIDVSGVKTFDGERTAIYSVTVESSSGHNWLYLLEGANQRLLPADFSTLEDPDTRAKPSLVVTNLELPQETVEQILETAQNEDVEILLNTAPAKYVPKTMYAKVTHLVMNETEAAMLSGRSYEQLKGMTEKVDLEGLNIVADYFLNLGVKHVVITLGEQGAFYSSSKGAGQHIEAVKGVKVLDPTGAG